MKWMFLFCALVGSGFALAASAPTVSNVSVRQRDAYNGLVDIDYTLGGETSGLAVEISICDRETGWKYRPTAFTVSPPASAGKHRATWNPLADGISVVSTSVVATVSLVGMPQQPTENSLYLVVDLSCGPSAAFYPISYLDTEPQGGWTDEYKTTKLVLRHIQAGTFTMGSPADEVGRESDETLHEVTITKPFYMGVFEVTQRQWELVMGTNPSDGSMRGATRPVGKVFYLDIYGYNPYYSNSKIGNGRSFLEKLRAKTGLDGFDLPTEAQWEYACRAGTTSKYNNGGDTEDDLKKLGRYSGNKSDGCGGYTGAHTAVGSYAPNAWGLYDMHGNIWEWCSDYYGDLASNATVDPVVTNRFSDKLVMRGGNYANNAAYCRSAKRGWVKTRVQPGNVWNGPGIPEYGFRLCYSIGLHDSDSSK